MSDSRGVAEFAERGRGEPHPVSAAHGQGVRSQPRQLLAQVPGLTLESLPRPKMPPAERGPVVPAQVERWRQEALAYEHGDGVPRDPVRAVQLYCRASRYGDAEAQYAMGWMLTNSRGIERDEAQAAHMFAAAAEQCRLGRGQLGMRHHQVDVAEQPCL